MNGRFAKAALILVIDQALDWRAGSDGDSNALAKVDSGSVPGTQERRATRTRRFALRTVHHAVDHQRVFVAEKTRETHRARFGGQQEVLRNLTARGQRAPLRRDTLQVAPQFDLFDDELIASRAILRAFVGIAGLVSCRQIRAGTSFCMSCMKPPGA